MCMFGNPSYDLGVLIGSLLIWHHIHMLNPDRHEERRLFCHNLEQCILDMCDSYFEELHGVPEPVTPKFMYYVAGFAACEIFFRYILYEGIGICKGIDLGVNRVLGIDMDICKGIDRYGCVGIGVSVHLVGFTVIMFLWV